MTRPSHPPTLLTLARRALEDEIRLPPGSRLVVAVSGGPDSMALLHVLARLSGRARMELVAHGVDHGLRPEAALELDLAEQLARALKVPFERTRVALAEGGNLQARAREARYAALEAAAARADAAAIATAHHADDRAETVIMRLLRGAGPDGLAVLPATADRKHADDPLSAGAPPSRLLVRPFLRARRADVLAHLRRHEVAFAEDPSNLDRRFLRTRVRHEVMPLLEDLSPGVVRHLCALADHLHVARGLVATSDRGKHRITVSTSRRLLPRGQT